MRYRFCTLDVFTEVAFGGNPLAVLPDARGLSDRQMQCLAREFNYSESTFVLPARHGHTREVRIFTPTAEVPFAGHPNIGTAHALDPLPDVDLRLRIAQGVEMGRPSALHARVEKRGNDVTGAWIGGASVLVSEGWIECPADP